jgi:hypothetical protein
MKITETIFTMTQLMTREDRNVLSRVCVCDSRRIFGLYIGFIDHLNTRLVNTLNYSAIADPYILQITTAHRLVFSVCYSLH